MPYQEDGGRLRVATSDPSDIDTQENSFILNRDVEMSIAMRDHIKESISNYGQETGALTPC